MKKASPVGIESVTYGVQDLSAGARFFEEFGLAKAECGQSGATYLTQEGTAVHLRLAGDPGLPPPIESGPTVREVVWGVRSKDRKSTRLNSSHGYISYAVFCLKKKSAAATLSSFRVLPHRTALVKQRGGVTYYNA